MSTKMAARLDALLIYPIWAVAAGRGQLQRMLPPLGILSIASHLESQGFRVRVLDLHGDPMLPKDFRRLVRELRPRVVGITVLSNHFVAAHHIAALCKSEVPDCQVVAGGVHAEAHPEDLLRSPHFDAVGRGDGEELMAEVVQGRPFHEIMGLSYRNSRAHIAHNPMRTSTKDLDAFPFPAYHLLDLGRYFPAAGTYRNYPAMNALMTRGCPGKCNFCNSARTVLRGRSPEKMADMIQLLRQQHGIRQISFYDDTFTANPRAVRAFCQEMIRRKLDVTWVCYVRGDMFTEELAHLMSKAGCHQVLMGIETGSDRLMKDMGKPIDKDKYRNVVRVAHKAGIEVRGAFIFGHLNETRESLEETLQFAMELDLDFFQPSILTPYPGTEIFKQAKLEGRLVHEDYSRYGQGEAIMRLPNLSLDELQKFYDNSFFRYYLRPKMIFKQLRRLRSVRQFLDIFLAFKVFIIDGLSKTKSRQLMEWLEFDVEKASDLQITSPAIPRLTWEVRRPELNQALNL